MLPLHATIHSIFNIIPAYIRWCGITVKKEKLKRENVISQKTLDCRWNKIILTALVCILFLIKLGKLERNFKLVKPNYCGFLTKKRDFIDLAGNNKARRCKFYANRHKSVWCFYLLSSGVLPNRRDLGFQVICWIYVNLRPAWLSEGTVSEKEA